MKINNIKLKIIISCIIFFIISFISIYSVSNTYATKQMFWYVIGIIIILLFKKTNIDKILDISFILYIFLNIILIFLLIFGNKINGSKCWIILPKIGSFQPSEFMKIIIILINAKCFSILNKKRKYTFKSDFKTFLIIISLTLIPSILTFLQPDTGMVLIYFLISLVMLYMYGIKKTVILTFVLVLSTFIVVFFGIYFFKEKTFINIFGTSFFYRINRITDWTNNDGIQIKNALSAIKAAGIKGFGIRNTPIYIPEAHTDFIFSVFASNTGFIGSVILILNILFFDIQLFKLIKISNNKNYKYIVIGFLTMILYQQIQNIAMNIGLLPIIGITLPFISYGGSSLLSYMVILGIILNYKNIRLNY